MNQSSPSAQAFLAGAALLIMGGLGGCMMFFAIPASNATSLTFVLGALAGALTVGGSGKIADKITQSSGANPTIQPDAPTETPK